MIMCVFFLRIIICFLLIQRSFLWHKVIKKKEKQSSDSPAHCPPPMYEVNKQTDKIKRSYWHLFELFPKKNLKEEEMLYMHVAGGTEMAFSGCQTVEHLSLRCLHAV